MVATRVIRYYFHVGNLIEIHSRWLGVVTNNVSANSYRLLFSYGTMLNAAVLHGLQDLFMSCNNGYHAFENIG